jgi:hypothetical protein
VSYMACLFHFFRFQGTPNIWHLSKSQRYKFDTWIAPRIGLTEFAALIKFAV